MAIIANYPTFRWYATPKVVSSISATFADANPDTVSRAGMGDFVADGVLAGMVTKPNGTASNDSYLFTIDTVAANTLTFAAADAVVAEGPVACTLTSYWQANDGYEEFPGPNGHTNLVRAGGFTGGFTDIPTPWVGSDFNASVNSYATDTVAGTDEYHWYVSQRSDDPAKQFIDVTNYTNPAAPANTYSGTIRFSVNALAIAELGIGSAPTPTQVREAFKMVDVYCIRVSDGAIQWVRILEQMLGVSR